MRESSRRVIARLRTPLASVPESPEGHGSPPVRIRRSDPPDFQAAYRRVSSELEQQRLALERRNRELAGLLESTFQLASELDQRRLLEKVLEEARRLLGAHRVTLCLRERGTDRLDLAAHTDAHDGEAVEDPGLPLVQSLAGEILATGRTYQIDDIQAEPRWRNAKHARKAGLHGYLGVPLVFRGEAIGLMSILTSEPRHFGDDEVELARSFAGQAAVAITNARLYQDARRHAHRLAELNDLGALVASSLNREEVLRRVVHAGQRLLGAGLVRLWLLDESGAQLELVAGAGPSEDQSGAKQTLPVRESLAGRAVRKGRPFRSQDVLAEPLFRNRAFAEREGLRACIVVPLLHEGKALGALAVLAGGGHHFEEEDVDLLQALAGYAALALENARLADEVGRLEGLRELDRLKAEFLSTISHELRTPLSLIHGYGELLSLRPLPPEQVRGMASEILGGSSRMIRMVDELLDFSGLETGQLVLRKHAVDLGPVVAAVSRELVGSSSRHSLRLDIPDDLPRVCADPDRLRQVMVHLVTNALQYSPAGGEIVVRARVRGDRARVSIADQGVGIEPDEQERVFEKFYRARDALVSTVRGTGLGLAIVRYLVEAHGGTVELRSVPRQGSTFSFSLPLARAEGS